VALMVLAVLAVGVGFLVGPLMPERLQFSHFVGQTPYFPHEAAPHGHPLNWGLMAVSSLFALGGIGVAYLMYVRQPDLPGRLAKAAPALYQLSLNKFHFDELYVAFLVKPLQGFMVFARSVDQYLVDGLVDAFGHVPRLVGGLFRPVQNGLVQFYALAMVLGLTVFLLALVRAL